MGNFRIIFLPNLNVRKRDSQTLNFRMKINKPNTTMSRKASAQHLLSDYYMEYIK